MKRETLHVAVRATLFCFPTLVFFNDYIGGLHKVRELSMQPVLNQHLEEGTRSPSDFDVIWESKRSIQQHIFKPGSIVVFRNPYDPNERMVKRLIAVGGDVVHPRGSNRALIVPQGKCWVEGDNNKITEDSNQFGLIPLALVESNATHVVWPPRRIRQLSQELPEYHKGTFQVMLL